MAIDNNFKDIYYTIPSRSYQFIENAWKKYKAGAGTYSYFCFIIVSNASNSIMNTLAQKCGFEAKEGQIVFDAKLECIFDNYRQLGCEFPYGRNDEEEMKGDVARLVKKYFGKQKLYQHYSYEQLADEGYDAGTMAYLLEKVSKFWFWAFGEIVPPAIETILSELRDMAPAPDPTPDETPSTPSRQTTLSSDWDDKMAPSDEEMERFFKLDSEQLNEVGDSRMQLILCVDTSLRMTDTYSRVDDQNVTLLEHVIQSITTFYQSLMDSSEQHAADLLVLKDSLEVMVCTFGGKEPCIPVKFSSLENQQKMFQSLRSQMNDGKGKGRPCLASALRLASDELTQRRDKIREYGHSLPNSPVMLVITSGHNLYRDEASREEIRNEVQQIQQTYVELKPIIVGQQKEPEAEEHVRQLFDNALHVTDLSEYLTLTLRYLQRLTQTEGGSERYNEESTRRSN